MTSPATYTNEQIARALARGPLTAKEVARCIQHANELGVASALAVLAKRGMVARLKRRTRFEPYRYRLKTATQVAP